MLKAPCYNYDTNTDCPRRCVNCRVTCDRWKQYEIDKAAYIKQRDAIRLCNSEQAEFIRRRNMKFRRWLHR